ncbi:ATP-binding protein [Pasteurella skyensis]|uniref:Aerobic respiration control sensor protein n=2 Tax=Phocoenobacter skyensis TaxID=97481 RepID=A0AAJ6NA39_9PAST|nr:ATP-binding protein [Pasteurella skyensis]MDP8173008.1 ATP-binding protein [Pasteurella skyensis]MDP8179467.1 ATP-binding protein [Pasteurella skyensis]MDP8183679.1 ATP-binding protein [Pasteurella skyensis]MDP8189624.1 ATP-binding protein [Pasteurella skyensis]MDP8199374.1 ATP-binding protein [Pasteurella skyensis]
MKNIRQYNQKYINWVLRLGRIRAALLGFFILAISAIIVQCLLSFIFTGTIDPQDILLSSIFGLISAPFVLYFFNLIVERLELSRIALERSVYDLSLYKDIIEQKNKDKTQLMAIISHELRTPLNGIIGLSRILLEDNLTQQQRDYLQTINVSAISLGHIFSDIIDLEKIDTKRIELSPTPTAFSDIINNITHFANVMAQKNKIKFYINYDQTLPDFITVDNTRLSQILWNLISNAIKFTPAKGEIHLTISRTSPNHFSFILTDSGVGIPKAEQHKIFTMFYQVQNSHNKAQGSGIGLAISKVIANLMQGDLTVTSEIGKGSTFTLTIQAEESAVKKVQPTIQHHHLKVLLVEDIETNVVVARSVLEKFGCEVDVAMCGAETYPLVDKNYYDLILLDIQLPDTTGFEIAQTLIHNYETDKMDYLPILVALTANVMHTKEEYQQQGMDDVLGKPLSIEDLSNCLNKYFSDDFSQIEDKIEPVIQANLVQNKFINTQILQEFLDIMGKEALLKNIALFTNLMPDYLKNLNQYHQEWQKTLSPEIRKSIAEEAHKIKGALSSVGLSHLQNIAQLAQVDTGIEWEKNITDWIQEIEQTWQQNLTEAENWVKSQ